MDFQYDLWPSETDDAHFLPADRADEVSSASKGSRNAHGLELAASIRRGRYWGDEIARRRRDLVEEVTSELASASTGAARDLLSVVLEIASAQIPCPLQYVPAQDLHVPSHRAIYLQAGIHPATVRRNEVLSDLADRFIGRLETPGCKIDVVGRKPTVRYAIEYEVSKALDRLELSGERIPAHPEKDGYGSRVAFCEKMQLDYDALQGCLPAQRQFIGATRLAGALGPPVDLHVRRDRLGQHLQKTMDWFDIQAREGKPLPVDPDDPTKACDRQIAELVDPDGPPLTNSLVYRRRRDEHICAFGLERAGECERHDTVDAFRTWSAKASTRDGKAIWTANRRSSFGRLLEAFGLGELDSVRPLVSEKEAALCEAAVSVGKRRTLGGQRNIRSDVRVLRRLLLEFSAWVGDLPLDPRQALAVAIERSGKSRAQVAHEAGLPVAALTNYLSGANPLAVIHRDKLESLDRALGTGGTLAPRIEISRRAIHSKGSEYFRQLPHRIRRHFTQEDLSLDDDELRRRVQLYEAKVERQDRDFTRSQDARSKYWKKVPPPARSCPIFNEVEQIVAHKSAIDPELERSPNGAWEKDSAKIFRRHIERFARYACASAELGGLGLEPDRVSLALLLNRKVVLAYIDFCSRLRVDPDEDVPLQPLLTAYDLNFVHFIRMLMHPRYGFITQRSDIFLPMIQADERPLGSCEGLDSIRARKFTFEDFDREEDATRYSKTPEEFGSLGPLVPDDLRARAEDDWLRLVIDTNARLGNMYSYMKRLVEKSRDPFEPVQEILEAERPLDHVTAMIEHAYGALPKQEAQPMLHAIAVRNLLVFLLLCVTCLRSQNIRELLYRSGDGGQIVLDRDGDTPIGLRLHIPWESFKNFSQVDFFGTPDTKRDYERYCHDWWGLAHLFDHYVENCLPLLSDRAIRKGKRVYSVLFPDSNGTAMTYDALGQIIRDFTRLNWVIDPLTGLPVEGRMAFGPHAIRDILATHIVRTATDEGRWERAANLLQTSVAMVKARYAFEKTLERAAKSDPIFDQQQAGFDRRLVLGLAR